MFLYKKNYINRSQKNHNYVRNHASATWNRKVQAINFIKN